MVDPNSIKNIMWLTQALGLQEITKKLQGVYDTMCNNTQAPENTIKLYVETSISLWNELELQPSKDLTAIPTMKIDSYKQSCGFMPVYDNELKLLEDYPKGNYSEINISQKDYVERIKKK